MTSKAEIYKSTNPRTSYISDYIGTREIGDLQANRTTATTPSIEPVITQTPSIITTAPLFNTPGDEEPSSRQVEKEDAHITPEIILAQQLKLIGMLEQFEKEHRLSSLRTQLFEDAGGQSDSYEIRSHGKEKRTKEPEVYMYEKRKNQNQNDDLSKPYRPPAFLTHSKFTDRIAHAEFPQKLKMPSTVTKYDGTNDPNDHLGVFVSAGGIKRWTMPVWCHMFVQTLIGAARTWFDSLPEGEIDSFESLVEKFMKHFSQQKRHLKGKGEIHNIRRRDGERVEDFITRYNQESLQIKGAGEDLRVSGFIHGVRNDDLVRMMHRDGAPETIEQVMEAAKSWVRRENVCARMREIDTKKDKHKEAWKPGSYKDRNNARWNKEPNREQYTSKFVPRARDTQSSQLTKWGVGQSFTPLTKSPSEILATENVQLEKPNPMNPNTIKNPKKYCEFHKDKGHDTDSCWQLKKQIEYAIKNGKLSHLVKEIKEGGGEKNKEHGTKREREVLAIKEQSPSTRKRPHDHTEDWMSQEISFPAIIGVFHASPVIITTRVADHRVHRILIDSGSSSDVMYEHCFKKLDSTTQSKLKASKESLSGFTGEQVATLGRLTLPVHFGTTPTTRIVNISFLVIQGSSAHNAIIGQPGLSLLGGVASTIHGSLKFPTPEGIGTIYSNKVCAEISQKEATKSDHKGWVLNQHYPEQALLIGNMLTASGKDKLKRLLIKYEDVFAWQLSDMTGVPRSLADDKLDTYKAVEPVAQKRRSMGAERSRAVREEVNRLVEAGILREVKYQTWIANPVMVTKHDGSWRMCVDFKNLNKACPKDCYPLPEIDLKIDSLAPFKYNCFLDAYKGYHQMQMTPDDEDKTTFYTPDGIFCYTKMPFGLKNAGATYQRLMDFAFKNQIGRNIEVYVDDIVIKSKTESEMLQDIEETFIRLREINLKLNPRKCSFGVEKGKFLGMVVFENGMCVNPDKVTAIMQMKSPRTLKDV
ncbi:hypothetical protein QVD17_08812 [Tagetes erecta]|uniref:Reverse transcriptase domain-containing protein n=1 Tax=Tagetes erecta TaxID=13708 RepID=A0AAD8KYB1_TARER|nr:hypothetical protein QVD17_08812 [Tagetes erecta]